MELKIFEKFKDINTMSESERLSYIEMLKSEAEICNLTQEVAKLCLNSIYGALANEFFHFFKVEMAEAITLQGQEAIKFSEKLINDYFQNQFHTDYELLEVLGISDFSKVKPIKNDMVVYVHTDSCAYFTKNTIKEEYIEIELEDDTLLKFMPYDKILVIREGKEVFIFAKDLLENDDIVQF